jgi:hypothetical protein
LAFGARQIRALSVIPQWVTSHEQTWVISRECRSPEKCIQRMLGEALHGCRHLSLKRLAPHLPVSDDLKASLLLESNSLIHGPVFDLFEIGRLQFPGSKFLLCSQQLCRAKQTTHYVGV